MDISIEYLNPSFLVKKHSGGYRLVTVFADAGQYDSMKYCGVATPFKGVRVYVRSAMGMPGSETALEELMCRILGHLLQEGIPIKIADNLYCGGNTSYELLENWKKASPHRITTLASCPAPETVARKRLFIGAYKVLTRVLPNCSRFMAPLDDIMARRQSNEAISRSDDLRAAFKEA
ncbi:hypothetical protein P5673_027003 [Acropora cervicornis]|uniref:Uncharacterized protein n=1 Tax=Acropora cervicornis TaxID=6130 RepID=A0AAD9PZL5_ACRCE|nr:hypothetical protein P5673_027003 [Acropora cervicornis]